MIGSLIVMFMFLVVFALGVGAALGQMFWTPPSKDNFFVIGSCFAMNIKKFLSIILSLNGYMNNYKIFQLV